jgi:hypothetical protein
MVAKNHKCKRPDMRIRVDAENNVVRVAIGGLTFEAASKLLGRAHGEAMKLLDARTRARRFRPPHTVWVLDADGRVEFQVEISRGTIRVGDANEKIGGFAIERKKDASSVSSIVAEDGRGRQASIRLEVTLDRTTLAQTSSSSSTSNVR